jgi:hypothetical protein
MLRNMLELFRLKLLAEANEVPCGLRRESCASEREGNDVAKLFLPFYLAQMDFFLFRFLQQVDEVQ